MRSQKKTTEEQLAQEAAAEELQQQIDELISGHLPFGQPRSLRDFIEQESLKKQQGQAADTPETPAPEDLSDPLAE